MADTILIEVINLYNWEPLKKTSRAQMILEKLGKRKVDELLEGFAYYVLNFYKALILNAIKLQKFPQAYQPLSPAHVNRKRKMGWKLGFWEMTGFLQQNLTIWKDARRSYCIGFKAGIIHPVSGTPLLTIVKTLEMGSPKRGIPARPLFMPLAAGISKHIYDVHWKKFLREKHPQIYKDMLYEEQNPEQSKQEKKDLQTLKEQTKKLQEKKPLPGVKTESQPGKETEPVENE